MLMIELEDEKKARAAADARAADAVARAEAAEKELFHTKRALRIVAERYNNWTVWGRVSVEDDNEGGAVRKLPWTEPPRPTELHINIPPDANAANAAVLGDAVQTLRDYVGLRAIHGMVVMVTAILLLLYIAINPK